MQRLSCWVWAMIPRRLSRHTTYYEVLDALQEDGCPICRLGLRAVSRYLHVLSYEGVNDAGNRAELCRARGFCHGHAWQFATEVHDGLGTAIIYRDVLSTLLHLLQPPVVASLRSIRRPPVSSSDTRARQTTGSGLASRLLPQGPCPACQTLARSSRRYLDTLLLHLADAEMQRRYRASGGLCRQHLALALPRVQRTVDLELLVKVCRERLGRVRDCPLSSEVLSLVEALVGKPLAVGRGALSDSAADLPASSPEVPLDLAVSWVHSDAGCPACRAVGAALDAWLVASAHEPGTDGLLDLCNVHAWRLVGLTSPAQAGAAWRQAALLVAQALSEVPDTGPVESAGWRRLWELLGVWRESGLGRAAATRIQAQTACPACLAEATLANRAVQAFLEWVEAGRLADRLPGAMGLCLPHLALGLRLVRSEADLQVLLASTRARWWALRAELDEYLRKQDYRFRREPYGAEVDAPWRAVAGMVGEVPGSRLSNSSMRAS